MLLSELAQKIGGNLTGSDLQITGCASLESAKEGSLSLVDNAKFLEVAKSTKASALIVKTGMEVDIPHISCERPMLAFSKAITILHGLPHPHEGIDPTAYVHPNAIICEGVSVGPHAYVGHGAKIGCRSIIHPQAHVGRDVVMDEDCVIHPHAVVQNAVLGKKVVVGPGTVIGSDGFKTTQDENGNNLMVAHIGKVRLCDNVEIEANCAIDRGFLDDTVIEENVKFDNLIHIAHNVHIGENSLIAGQFGTAGSTTIGKRFMCGGQVGIADHLTMGDDVIMAAKSGVLGSIKESGVYAGIPAMPIGLWRRAQIGIQKLPEMIKTVNRLDKANKKEE